MPDNLGRVDEMCQLIVMSFSFHGYVAQNRHWHVSPDIAWSSDWDLKLQLFHSVTNNWLNSY